MFKNDQHDWEGIGMLSYIQVRSGRRGLRGAESDHRCQWRRAQRNPDANC